MVTCNKMSKTKFSKFKITSKSIILGLEGSRVPKMAFKHCLFFTLNMLFLFFFVFLHFLLKHPLLKHPLDTRRSQIRSAGRALRIRRQSPKMSKITSCLLLIFIKKAKYDVSENPNLIRYVQWKIQKQLIFENNIDNTNENKHKT